jgi:hypothetical protein
MTLEDLKKVQELIKEYSAHDTEAFNSRTEMFKMMMMLTDELEIIIRERG